MLTFSYWYVKILLLDAHLILPVNSHGLYSSRKIHNAAIYLQLHVALYIATK